MGGAWYLARSELRGRIRSTLLLALLVAVAAGAVLATVAGARRSSSAYDRFREETLAADLDVAFDGPPGELSMDEAAALVAEIPQVQALERLDYPFIVPAGSGFYPYLDFLAAVNAGDTFDAPIERPRVYAGRIPDPLDPDEVAITTLYAEESGLGVGDRAEFESFAPDQMEALFSTGDAGPPAGPRLDLEVVGIFSVPSFLSESSGDFVPRVFLSPAFVDEHLADVATYPGGMQLRLHRGAADVDEVTAAVRELFADVQALEITPSSDVDQKVDASIDVIVTALGLCALVAGLAGIVAIAQALARHFGAQGADDRWLAAVGLTRVDRLWARTVSVVPIALIGAAMAVLVAITLSPLMPVGVARRAEPDRGVSIDGAVLGVGFVATVALVLVLAAVAAAAMSRRSSRTVVGATAPPSRALAALRRTTLAPTAAAGAGMALDPRRGTGAAVRSAQLGVAFGVAGLCAVAVFVASTDDLVSEPSRYGAPFDGMVSGFSGDVLADGGDALLADPQIERAGVILGGLVRVDGAEVNSHAFESLKGAMAFTVLEGRVPEDRGEVLLGAATMDAAEVRIGDDIEVEGIADTLRATVVGKGSFPVLDERSGAGRGVLLIGEDFEDISSDEEVNADVLIDWAEGVDVEEANSALAEATETEVFAPRLPSDVNNVKDVDELPRVLGAFLAVLALLAVVHALVTTVRMRREELAVLRTLGFDHRQVSTTVAWQATTIGAVGVLVGVPLGVMLGRVVWRAVASDIGVVDDPVAPLLALVAVGVGTLLVVNVVAIIPGRAARRSSPADALRAG